MGDKRTSTLRKRLARRRAKVRMLVWSAQNWWRGYAFGPVQRCRTCSHTTPNHYATCNGSSQVGERA